jgi:hypothetical protein
VTDGLSVDRGWGSYNLIYVVHMRKYLGRENYRSADFDLNILSPP